jgi:hypothetical protein
MGILKEFDESLIESFSKDLFLVMGALSNIDSEYSEGKEDFTHEMKHFKRLLEEWNNKYPLLKLKEHEDGIQLKMKIFINEKDMLSLAETASKIDNLTSINGKNASLDSQNISNILAKTGNSIDMIYTEGDEQNSLTFEKVKKELMLVYDIEDMTNKKSPEFQICAYYGLKNFDKSINLQRFSSLFSFDTDVSEREGKGDGYLNRVRIFDKI